MNGELQRFASFEEEVLKPTEKDQFIAGFKYIISIKSYNLVPEEDYISTNFQLEIFDLGSGFLDQS